MHKSQTKRALLTSVLALVLCVAMFASSTYAWFTDTASTGVNKITSGNLDVKLEYSTDNENWKPAEGVDGIFSTDKWEPGYTQVVYFKVANAGALAFKYYVTTNISSETEGKNLEGNPFKLSDYLQFGIIEVTKAFADRDAARAAIKTATKFGAIQTGASSLETGKSATFAMVVWMPEDTDNDANHNGVNKPEINFGVSIVATQLANESDSFNNQYDKDALFSNERLATNDSELIAALNEALTNPVIDTIILNGNFGATKLPAGTKGVTLVTNSNATMESLNLNGAKNVTVDGLTFDAAKAATVYSNASVGGNAETVFAASIYDSRWDGSNFGDPSENITIKNCTFQGTATVVEETGYAAICINENGAGKRAKNYTVESCTFNCNAVSYVYFNYLAEGTAVIKNNTFGGTAYSTTYGNVGIVNSYTDATISGNTFYNWDKDDSAIKASCPSGTTSENYSKYNVTDNTFNGTVDQKAVIEIRRCGTDHIVSGNNYSGVTGRTCSDTDTSASSANVTVYFRG